MDYIERIFYQDSFEKKRIGANVTKRASRRGYIRGGIRTQYDFLSSKEKRKLNGEVKVTYMYSEISSVPKMSEIKKMDSTKAKNIITIVKNNFSNKDIMNHWGIRSAGSLYNLFEKYGVHQRKEREEKSKKPTQNKKPKHTTKEKEVEEIKSVTNNKSEVELKSEIMIQRGFKIEFSGEFSKDEVEKKLIAISGILSNENNYEIKLIINELDKPTSIDLVGENNMYKALTMPEL